MIHDYSGRYFPVTGHRVQANRLIFRRKNAHQVSANRLLWKSVGAMLVLALAVGVTSSFWLGNQIRTTLDSIGNNRVIHTALTLENDRLLGQRNRLLSRDRIEAAAKNLGLYPPSATQIRHP